MGRANYGRNQAKMRNGKTKGGGRRTGALEFRVRRKGGSQRIGLGPISRHAVLRKWIRMLETAPPPSPRYIEGNKPYGKLEAQGKK